MITLGRSGYPKNIPRDTVDKLCMKMYPPFANRGKKTAAGAGGSTDFSMVNTAAFMTGGGWCMYASAKFEKIVLGCINADFCNETLIFQHVRYLRDLAAPFLGIFTRMFANVCDF